MIDIEKSKLALIELYDRALNGSKETMSLIKWNDTIKKAITRLEELEKREVPMKPEKMHRNEYGNYGTCANCKKSVSLSHYCPHCGQKLDWSDEK